MNAILLNVIFKLDLFFLYENSLS
ncbi:uncharacterized protein METZ01_LOCUS195749 [marine metagenome]|uniref:Uncharacterized protein n=1 Tax=marine metagenome TaxID=408172 RepID=A0A382DXB9_9ZZZZ